MALGAAALGLLGREAAAVVARRPASPRRPAPVDPHLRRAWPRRGRGRCAAPPAPCGRRAARPPEPARPPVDLDARRRPRASPAAPARSARAGSRPAVLEVRRVDLDEQGAQAAHALARAVRGRAQCRRVGRRSARSARAARPSAMPARSWTTPSCRSAAIRRRSASERLDRAQQQRLALALVLASRRASDSASGSCSSHSSRRAASSAGANDARCRAHRRRPS